MGTTKLIQMSLSEALTSISKQPWEKQEACYGVLIKLLGNPAENPQEEKFRSVKKSNAAIKAKVLDIPGGSAVLLAAGFQEQEDKYDLVGDASMETVQKTLDSLKEHVQKCRLDNIRKERDKRIAAEKAAEAELNKHGGFSRGLHNLTKSAAPATVPDRVVAA